MTEFKNSSEFVKALLVQEPTLDAAAYREHRRKLLDRLAAAERQERRGRYISIAAAVIAPALSTLYLAAIFKARTEEPPPEWMQYILMMGIILLPFTAILLVAVYFFRHRRELRHARNDVYSSALLDLPRQIEELRRQIEELRRERPAGKSEQ